jgi:hypothetical protein
MFEINLENITKYIMESYPNSCMAVNYNGLYEPTLEECIDFFYYEKLKWCGCGDPDMAKRVVRDYLRILNEDDLYYKKTNNANNAYSRKCKMFSERFGVQTVYDNELLLCLAYTLDAAEFTEHGSGIGGAWITSEGKMFLWLLENEKDVF